MSTAATAQSETRIVNGRIFHVTRIATAIPTTQREKVNANGWRHVHANHVRHFVPEEPGVERP
jgi:hypothetical protein